MKYKNPTLFLAVNVLFIFILSCHLVRLIQAIKMHRKFCCAISENKIEDDINLFHRYLFKT